MEDARFNFTHLSSWLEEQPWASTLLPNFRQCDFNGRAFGPPGIEIPVAALTTTATTTVDGGHLPTHALPKPAGSQTPIWPDTNHDRSCEPDRRTILVN